MVLRCAAIGRVILRNPAPGCGILGVFGLRVCGGGWGFKFAERESKVDIP